MISLLEQRLSKDLVVFEYGSGYSTSFFSQRVKSVASVENSSDWYDRISDSLPDNSTLMYRAADTDGAYCRAINDASEKIFDVILVDGRDRVNCVKQAFQKLTGRGVILVDDVHRQDIAQGVDYLVSNGFKLLECTGLKPVNRGVYRSAIFYRPDNCLRL